jgi:hypothetical protein
MSTVNNGPQIIKGGLVMLLDSYARGSYLPNSLINMNNWTVSNGSVTGYNQNGATAENQRSAASNPWGQTGIIWGTFPLGETNDDGGWNTDWFNIDNTKLYRFSVWVKRTSSTSGGTFYLGMYANGDGSRRMDNSAVEGNAYWSCIGTGGLTQDVWYLYVGHVYPFSTSYTGRHPDTGYYFANNPTKQGDVNGCNIGTGDLKWSSNSTQGIHRTYHYYCGDSTTRLQFYNPRVDLVDGKQPSINELVSRSPIQWKDLTANQLNASGNVSYISSTGVTGGASWTTAVTDILNTDTHSIFFMLKLNSSVTYPTGTTGSWEKIFSYNAGGSDRTPSVWRYPSERRLHWRYDPANTGADFGKNSSNEEFDLNTWYYVGVTKNNATALTYVNGVNVSSSVVAYPKTAGSSAIIINESYSNSLNNVNCVQVYNRVLTASEVAQNFQAIKTRFGL